MKLTRLSKTSRNAATFEEKAKRRALPSTYEAWQNEVDGIVKFLMGMGGIDLTIDQQWLKNMVAYYNARLEYLHLHQPKETR